MKETRETQALVKHKLVGNFYKYLAKHLFYLLLLPQINTRMKKKFTFELETDLIDQMKTRAAAETRNLTNFIELVFKAAIKTQPAPPPVLQLEAQEPPKAKEKVKHINKVKETTQRPETMPDNNTWETQGESTTIVIPIEPEQVKETRETQGVKRPLTKAEIFAKM
jgi:hypothetical protein